MKKGTSIQILVVTCLAAALPVISSATVGLAEDERTGLILNPNPIDERNGHGVIYNDGTLSLTPLDYSYTETNTGENAVDTASVLNHTDFGDLQVSISGTSQSSSESGAFTFGSTYVGGDITTGFHDEVTASVDSLVDFTYTITGTSSSQGNADGGTYANTLALYQVGGTSFNGNMAETALNGTTIYTGTVQLNAGKTYQMFFGLGYDTEAYSNDLSSRFASFSESARATLVVTNETAGSTLRFGSGHDYTQAAPEPVGLAILAFGVAGMICRPRR